MEAWNKSRNIEALGLLKWEDLKDHPLQQDFADMLGWKDLAEKTERFYHSLPDSTKERTMVLAGNYGQAGALKYYAKDTAFINRVCSSNGSFLLWLPDHPGFHHILDIDEDDPQQEEPLFRQFSSMHMIDSVTDPYARERGTKIMFFQNASDSARMIAGSIIRQIKGQYLR